MNDKAENLKEQLGRLLNTFRELDMAWGEYNKEHKYPVEVPSYPFTESFDKVVGEIEEWVEDFSVLIDDIEIEKAEQS